jgi:hypothetical protein
VNEVVLGAIVMASATVGLFFFRFWRQTRDRLFATFALAFWVLALNWLALAIVGSSEVRPLLYLMRLAAFSLIIVGIVDKNRAATRSRAAPPPPGDRAPDAPRAIGASATPSS